MVLREVLLMAAVGLGTGLTAAVHVDPVRGGVIGGLVPARQASRVDPWTELRDE
jgi:hypothetical protein